MDFGNFDFLVYKVRIMNSTYHRVVRWIKPDNARKALGTVPGT